MPGKRQKTAIFRWGRFSRDDFPNCVGVPGKTLAALKISLSLRHFSGARILEYFVAKMPRPGQYRVIFWTSFAILRYFPHVSAHFPDGSRHLPPFFTISRRISRHFSPEFAKKRGLLARKFAEKACCKFLEFGQKALAE